MAGEVLELSKRRHYSSTTHSYVSSNCDPFRPQAGGSPLHLQPPSTWSDSRHCLWADSIASDIEAHIRETSTTGKGDSIITTSGSRIDSESASADVGSEPRRWISADVLHGFPIWLYLRNARYILKCATCWLIEPDAASWKRPMHNPDLLTSAESVDNLLC